MTTLADNCHELTAVSCVTTDSAAISLATHCRRLTDVVLSGKLFTDAAVISLAARCRRLTNVALSGCELLTDAAAVSLATHCN